MSFCGIANLLDLEKVADLLALLEIHPRQMTRAQLSQAREQAGLSLGQAARLLGVNRHELAMIELISHIDHYWAARREMVADRMAAVYCCGGGK